MHVVALFIFQRKYCTWRYVGVRVSGNIANNLQSLHICTDTEVVVYKSRHTSTDFIYTRSLHTYIYVSMYVSMYELKYVFMRMYMCCLHACTHEFVYVYLILWKQ